MATVIGQKVVSKVAVIKPKEKPVKKKTSKTVNPLFENIIDYTDDHFWKGLFRNCSIGKFPPGFKYYNNKLFFYKKKNDDVSFVVPEDPSVAVVVIMNFMKFYGGILSPSQREDVEKQKDEELYNEYLRKLQSTNAWTDIKSKTAKMELLDRFTYQTAQTYNFDKKTKDRFSFLVKLGILSKAIPNENIIIRQGEIEEIKGISYDSEEQKIICDEWKVKIVKKPEIKEKKVGLCKKQEGKDEKDSTSDYFFQLWVKFIRDISGKGKKELSMEDLSEMDSKMEEMSTTSIPRTPNKRQTKTTSSKTKKLDTKAKPKPPQQEDVMDEELDNDSDISESESESSDDEGYTIHEEDEI